MASRAAVARLFPLALLVAGCSLGQPGSGLRPVGGTVTHRGRPLAGVEVVFLPAAPGEGTRAGRGLTDSGGRYALKTYLDSRHDAAGAVPGDYRVIISATAASGEDEKRIVDPSSPSTRPGPAPTPALPLAYSDPATTVLSASVAAVGSSTVNFDLVDPPPPPRPSDRQR